VVLYAYKSKAYLNKVVGHAIFTKRYVGHVNEKVEKHCYISCGWLIFPNCFNQLVSILCFADACL